MNMHSIAVQRHSMHQIVTIYESDCNHSNFSHERRGRKIEAPYSKELIFMSKSIGKEIEYVQNHWFWHEVKCHLPGRIIPHVGPMYPVAQVHSNPVLVEVQVPPKKQGLLAQLSFQIEIRSKGGEMWNYLIYLIESFIKDCI